MDGPSVLFTFGAVRLELWDEGVVLWADGQIRWRSWESDVVLIEMARVDIEHFSHALSDVCCWCRGFMAGCSEDWNHPISVNSLGTLNLILKRALEPKVTS